MINLTQQLQNLHVNQNQPIHNPPPPRQHQARRNVHNPPHVHELESNDDESDEGSRGRRRRPRPDDNDRGLQLDVSEFKGNLNPDDFIDWLNAIERVFDYEEYSEEKKCKVAILKFKKYASLWWESIKNEIEREGKVKIRSWTKLKKLLKTRVLARFL
ncbi:hypothetical protein CFOL_v3_25284 [Cephalotus follicularis]|uniref:Retrotransposon gag domain-containing protein n=1 Tax=Cephalotus follicularis TaxID=3775 RepID=A0A1Q3CNZ8_CEPFO|nr:hypothetical protein CFOL_v3_25284 [Cephalotus follicularis]